MEQKQPLLESDEEFIVVNPHTKRNHHTVSLCLSVYSLIVSISLAVTLFFARPSCHGGSVDSPKSIIQKNLGHELQPVHAHPGSIFSGPPSSEHDEAWSELLRPLFVSVTAEELRRLDIDPQQQLRLFEGGYIASLEVYHHLHCIRRLKWHMYESHYFANMTDTARSLEMNHMNHCIESLRIALMCTADTSLYTLKWRGVGKRPEPLTSARRACTVWEPIESWALPRAVSNSPKLVNPDKLRLPDESRSEEVDLTDY